MGEKGNMNRKNDEKKMKKGIAEDGMERKKDKKKDGKNKDRLNDGKT